MAKDIFVVLIILAIVAGIIRYLAVSRKKHGEACTGCPYAKLCRGKFNGCSNYDE